MMKRLNSLIESRSVLGSTDPDNSIFTRVITITHDCIKLKDAINVLIQRGKLLRFDNKEKGKTRDKWLGDNNPYKIKGEVT